MVAKIVSFKGIDKADYSSLALIVLYSLFVFFGFGRIFRSYLGSEDVNSPVFLNAIAVIVPLLVFIFVFVNYAPRYWAKSKLGLNTGKVALPSFFITILMLFYLVMTTNVSITIYAVLWFIPIVLNVMASELVLRVILTDLVQKFLVSPKGRVVIPVLLSSFLFIAIHSPLTQLSFAVIVEAVILSLIYVGTRSVIFLTLQDTLTILTSSKSKLSVDPSVAISAIAVYFVLAFAATFLYRTQGAVLPSEG